MKHLASCVLFFLTVGVDSEFPPDQLAVNTTMSSSSTADVGIERIPTPRAVLLRKCDDVQSSDGLTLCDEAYHAAGGNSSETAEQIDCQFLSYRKNFEKCINDVIRGCRQDTHGLLQSDAGTNAALDYWCLHEKDFNLPCVAMNAMTANCSTTVSMKADFWTNTNIMVQQTCENVRATTNCWHDNAKNCPGHSADEYKKANEMLYPPACLPPSASGSGGSGGSSSGSSDTEKATEVEKIQGTDDAQRPSKGASSGTETLPSVHSSRRLIVLGGTALLLARALC